MDDAARLEAARAAMAQGMLPKGQSLSRLLSKTESARLKRVAKDLHVPFKELDQLQPWLADVTLSVALINRYGGRTNEGVERVIDRQAPASVQRRAFETPGGQIAMFAGAPRSAQVASLVDTLRSIEKDPEAFETVVRLWVKGDVDGLMREAVLPIKAISPALYRALIQRRNADWDAADRHPSGGVWKNSDGGGRRSSCRPPTACRPCCAREASGSRDLKTKLSLTRAASLAIGAPS